MNRNGAVSLSWLDSPPVVPAGVTWGVPWKQGELGREAVFALYGTHGEPVPVQSWPTAYWPDGSVKWTAHAAAFVGAVQDGYVLSANPKLSDGPDSSFSPLCVNVSTDVIEIDTGVLLCRFNRSGSSFIREIIREGEVVCSGGELVGLREEVLQTSGWKTVVEEAFCGLVESAEVEQTGPVRAVVKWKGRHRMAGRGRKWLPFTVRCYLYAGVDAIRFVHTFIYDGNPHQDMVKGLGFRFAVPMSGPLYNRHIRLAGDTGWFSESPQGWIGFRAHERLWEWQAQQRAGERILLDGERDAEFLAMLEDMPVWNDFKLMQLSPDSYTICKRTQAGCSWIRAAAGNRSRGLVYAGSERGGVAIGVRHFWQKYPGSFEVSGCAGEEATMTCWLWSPDAPTMDLRHYDTKTHVRSCYEGADEMRSTPYGIANTSELTLWGCGRTPDMDRLDALAREKESPSLLVCEPGRYYDTKALGFWSLPDRSTPLKAQLEDILDQLIEFYENEIEQRRWYGFWDYGDVMHSYDPVRHTWKYDIGGCAWQNTELAPNVWLWYMFLRSGREDIFRLAEAMTRHTSEVDVYHIGEYAGLGSRHNVLHWGCGCKEARISMAGLHRFYYYLTADERIGDIMDEVKDADYTTVQLDPMRAYFAKDAFPTHTRSGPDWAAFCSNWLVQWERYEDSAYRDKLLKGIECLKRMPDRLLTGPVFGYDPKTGELMYMGDENYGHHLMICMGGAQVWAELSHLLQDEEWDRMLVEYGEFYHLPREEKIRRTDGRIQGKDWNHPMLATAMMAFAASWKGDRELAMRTWKYLLRRDSVWSVDVPLKPIPAPVQEYVRPIREIPWMSTNTASQWSINLIVCLERIGQYLPESLNLFEGGA